MQVTNRRNFAVEIVDPATGDTYIAEALAAVEVPDDLGRSLLHQPDNWAGEDGWEALTVDELKDELRSRDLPVSGTKEELVARLNEAEEA